jgi:predicted ribosome quality control (RQC) complex YloA/Tae2 family protein
MKTMKKLDLGLAIVAAVLLAGFAAVAVLGGSAQAASKKELNAQGCFFQQDAGTNGAWVNRGYYCGPNATVDPIMDMVVRKPSSNDTHTTNTTNDNPFESSPVSSRPSLDERINKVSKQIDRMTNRISRLRDKRQAFRDAGDRPSARATTAKIRSTRTRRARKSDRLDRLTSRRDK